MLAQQAAVDKRYQRAGDAKGNDVAESKQVVLREEVEHRGDRVVKVV